MNNGFCVPPRRGERLARFIRNGHRAGCPCLYLLGSAVVPITGQPPSYPPLSRAVVLALRYGEEPLITPLLSQNQRDVAVLKKMTAAFRRDILDVRSALVTEWLGHENGSSARRAAREGRKLLHQVGAWPWWCLPPKGELPKEWWREPLVVEELLKWRSA